MSSVSCFRPEGFEADLDEADLGVVGDQHQKKVFEVKIRVSADSVPKRTPQSVYIVLYGEEQCGADSSMNTHPPSYKGW